MPFKKLRKFKALVSIFLLLTAIETRASCETPRVPKRRILVNWCGACDREKFREDIKKSSGHLGRNADLQINALGAQWKDTLPPGPNSVSVEASSAGMAQTRQLIQKQLAELQRVDPSATAEDVEVIFFVSNHGGERLLPNNGKIYGITGDPDVPDSTVMESELEKIASQFPPGIRVRGVIGSCYSANTGAALQRGFERAGACSCMATLSPEGLSSYGEDWEGKIAELAGTRDFSLFQATISASPSEWVDASNKESPAFNECLTDSERVMWRYWASKEARVSGPANRKDLEIYVNKRHGDLQRLRQEKPLSPADRKILEESKKQRLEAIKQILGRKSMSDAELSMIRKKVLPISAYQSKKRAEYERIQREIERSNDQMSEWMALRTRAGRRWEQSYKELKADLERRQPPPSFEEREKAHADNNKYQQKRMDSIDQDIDSLLTSIDDLYDKQTEVHKQSLYGPNEEARKYHLVSGILARGDLEELFIMGANAEERLKFRQARACELQPFGPGTKRARTSDGNFNELDGDVLRKLLNLKPGKGSH